VPTWAAAALKSPKQTERKGNSKKFVYVRVHVRERIRSETRTRAAIDSENLNTKTQACAVVRKNERRGFGERKKFAE